MSAKARAFSRLDRESLQEAIAADNQWAKTWVQKREQKLVYLETQMSQDLIQEAETALFTLSRSLDFQANPEPVAYLWDIQGALSVWYRVLRKPQNVKVAVDVISKQLNDSLDSLASAGLLTRPN